MDIKELSDYKFGKDAKLLDLNAKNSRALLPNFSQRTFSYFIDFFIVSVIRFLASSILAAVWYNVKLKKIMEVYTFNSDNMMDFLIKFDIIYDFIVFTIIILLTGGLYFVLLYSSRLGATIGCIFMDIKLVVKKTGERVSFLRSLVRYVLCLVPVFCIIFMGFKYYNKSFDIVFILLFIVSALWYDLSLIFRLPQGMPDLITGTIIISTKGAKPSKEIIKNH